MLEHAANQVEDARKLNENEPLVWVSVAQLILVAQFNGVDFFDRRQYEESALAKAFAFASKAVQLDDAVVESHLMMAKLFIIARRFPEATHELAIANKLDPEGFKPWLYQAISYWKQGNARMCETALAGAEARARTDWDRRQALYQRETMAESRGDARENERLLNELIALEPKRP